MNLEPLYSIGVKRRVAGATDAHGNVVDTYADPISIEVYGIAPAYSNEPYEAGREAVITGLSILAPSAVKFQIGKDDLVVIDDKEYTVEGEIADWDRGPFGWTPGVTINLKRVGG